MNLHLLSGFILVIVSFQVQAISREREREILRQLLMDCKDKEGGSDSDLERMAHEQLPETREGSCMIACTYEIVGIVSLIMLRQIRIYLHFCSVQGWSIQSRNVLEHRSHHDEARAQAYGEFSESRR